MSNEMTLDFTTMTDEEVYAIVDEDLAEWRGDMFRAGWEASEIERRIAEERESGFCSARQISVCCRASYDLTNVVKSGRFIGHGSYLCSKCGKHLFRV